MNQVKTELLETKGTSEVKDMRIEELEERLGDMHQQTMGLNRTSELDSSGKIVHQGDDLRSLEMGSDGMIEGANDSFRVSILNFSFRKRTPLNITMLYLLLNLCFIIFSRPLETTQTRLVVTTKIFS